MELALVVSGNTAADILLREAGGPDAVTARMRALDIANCRTHFRDVGSNPCR
jgi:beta-lactamase class A